MSQTKNKRKSTYERNKNIARCYIKRNKNKKTNHGPHQVQNNANRKKQNKMEKTTNQSKTKSNKNKTKKKKK